MKFLRVTLFAVGLLLVIGAFPRAGTLQFWYYAMGALLCFIVTVKLKPTPSEDKGPDVIHAWGPRLAKSVTDARAAIAPAIARAGADFQIAPGLSLDSDAASRDFAIFGATGSGKSTVLWWFIQQILESSSRALINDTKGELVVLLKGVLMALNRPLDLIIEVGLRSTAWAWAVGVDVFSKSPSVLIERAQALADRIVEAPAQAAENAIFYAAARIITRAGIIELCARHGAAWGFRELGEALSLPYEELRELLKDHSGALRALGAGDRYTSSVIATLAPAADRCTRLGALFADCKGFSFSAWMRAKTAAQFAVLVADPAMDDLSRWVAGAITAVVATAMLDADVRREARESGRATTWLVLDEFASLGRLEQIQKIASLGRSLGVRLVLALQSYSQLEQTYGEHGARSVMACCSNAVLLQAAAGAANDQHFCAELIGKRTVKRRTISTSSTESKDRQQSEISTSKSTSENWHYAEEYLVPPPSFRSAIGVTPNGVTGFVLTPAATVLNPATGQCDPLVVLCRWPFAPRVEEVEAQLGGLEAGTPNLLSSRSPAAPAPLSHLNGTARLAEVSKPESFDAEMKAVLESIEQLAGVHYA